MAKEPVLIFFFLFFVSDSPWDNRTHIGTNVRYLFISSDEAVFILLNKKYKKKIIFAIKIPGGLQQALHKKVCGREKKRRCNCCIIAFFLLDNYIFIIRV